MKKIILIITLFYLGYAFPQGTIRGEIKDSKTGLAVPFAKVKVEGLNAGAVTDFDGLFNLKLNEGNYQLIINVLDYEEQKKSIQVTNNKVLELNIQINPFIKVKELEGATVVAFRKTANTIAGDDARRRESTNATDGISKEQMKATGDGDVGEVAQRVTGVSVEGGKHVYVRGLGDRYTKTILNGMEIPGLDPDRNTVQMDVFPTNLIDNVTVYKTFTPNLNGDFTGGLVDISTRDFPLKKTISFSAGFGFNTESTFNKNFLSYKGGKTDFLAFDDGTRALPVSPTAKFPDPTQNDETLSTMTKSFNKTMAPQKTKNFLDQNYSFSYGDQLNLKKIDYGYNVVLNYRLTNRMYDSVQFNEYRKSTLSNETDLTPFNKATGTLCETDVLWTILFGQSVKIGKKSKISLVLFHTQNGKKSASIIKSVNYEINPSTLLKQSLQYNQRSISNAQLNGSHSLNKWKVEWKLSPTYSKINDPDIRSTILEEIKGDDGQIYYDLNKSVGSEIRRIYRDLTEINLSGKIDFKYQFNVWDSLKSDFSFGIIDTYKKRNFTISDYVFDVENTDKFSSDPNFYFQEENIWTSERDQGTYGRGEKQLANTFVATQNVMGFYLMNDLPITTNWKVIYGARMEKGNNTYTGQNNSGSVKYNKQTVLDEMNILPSLNSVVKIPGKGSNVSNIRTSYAKTLARPSFREISVAQIYDPIQNRRYNGNIELKQTTIHNLDLRWEYFYGRTELLSASVFYKRFINPIEIVSFDLAPNEVKPVNAGTADVYGAEVELRKAIGFKKEHQSHLSFVTGINFTYVVSRIDMNKVLINKGTEFVTEKSLREENAREGEEIGNYRPMYGQSPFILNAFTTFKNDKLGLIFNLSYNVQGKKLAIIGVGRLPDVYEIPFHSLNCKIGKDLGQKKFWNISIAAQNILNRTKTRSYISHQAENQIYDSFYQGMTFTAAITYTIK
ncbi:MAG: carboxypeptidase-like regulatory domain-containing protein [Flavobacteriia bacterium]|nr:carboxypeptidase-like regulatory domain-containing protein [Flavobacteriia bacterium]